MAEVSSVSHVVVARATLLPQTAGATLPWDGRSGVCRAVGSQIVSEHGQPSAFQVKGAPANPHGARRSWTTEEIGLVPTCAPQAIAWDQTASPTPAVYPVLMVQAPSASLQVDLVTIVPDLPAHDPLFHHMTGRSGSEGGIPISLPHGGDQKIFVC
jgi:hypothetical protein